MGFNKAYYGVIAQGGPSILENGCLYRSNDKKCGVGHIIPDEFYASLFDDSDTIGTNTSIKILLSNPMTKARITAALIAGGIPEPELYSPFLSDLQTAHDEDAYITPYLPEFKVCMR